MVAAQTALPPPLPPSIYTFAEPVTGNPINDTVNNTILPVNDTRLDLTGGTNFTLAVCAEQTQRNVGYASVIMAKRRQYHGWMLGLEGASGNAGDTGILKFKTQGTTGDPLVSNFSLALNTRYHIAVVFSGGQATIFIDGERDATRAIPAPTAPPNPVNFRVGHETADVLIDAGHPQRWHGTLRDVNVFNIALNQEQLQVLSDRCNPPPPPPVPTPECREIIGEQIAADGTVTQPGVIENLLACYPLINNLQDGHDTTPGAILHHGALNDNGTQRHVIYQDPQGTRVRQAMYFDGSTFVEIPMHPEFMFKSGKPFSFALWAVFDNSLHYNPLLKLSDTDGAPQAGLAKRPYFDHRGRILARLATAANQTNVFSEERGGELLRNDQLEHEKAWIHIAGVFDGGELTLYVDGQPQWYRDQNGRWLTAKRLPFFDFANGTDMRLRIGANANPLFPTRHKGYISSVLIYDRALDNGEVQTLAGATDGLENIPFADDPCVHAATVTSDKDGQWQNGDTWTPARPGGPGPNDWVLIRAFHTVTMPPEMRAAADRRNVTGLCIERDATLQSAPGGSVALTPQFFHNRGRVRGQDASPVGGRVFINNSQWFVNNGRIVSGSGSKPGARGGRIIINANFIRNWGRIQGGDGQDGFCWPNKINAQPGGYVTVRTNATNRNFINLGQIVGGNGGAVPKACREVGLVPGVGGWVVANAGQQRGIIQGRGGVWADPAELIFDDRTQIDGENVFVVAGEDNTIEANNLLSDAILAEKVLTVAVGPDGILDLSQVADQSFRAGEEIKLFVDAGNLLLPPDKTVEDIFDAPILTQSRGKVLYFATWNTEEVVAGEPNATVTLPLNLFNAGPADDTYTITVQDSQGWSLCTLPATVSLDSQADTDLNCELTLPETTGVNNVITVTATSENDPDMQAIAEIEVYVGELPTPPLAPANAFPYAVSGMVINSEEQPIMGVKIQIGEFTALTDEDGYWEIAEVPEGKYPVIVTKEGYSFDFEKEVEVGNSDMTLAIIGNSLLALKVQAPTLVEQRADITYQFIVANQGEVTTTGITLALEPSSDVTILKLTGGTGLNCQLETLSCTLSSLLPGKTATATFVVNNIGKDTLAHKATLSSQNYPPEVRIIETKVRPDLWVNVRCQPNPVVMLEKLQCVVTVQLNDTAEETATGIQLSLPKPMGLEILDVTTPAGNKCDSSNSNLISCTLADLNKGKSTTVTLDMKLYDAGMLLVRQQGITYANNYSSDNGGGNATIFIPEHIKADLLVLVDTTGSMQVELDSVIAAFKQFISNLPDSPPLTMALIEFKDDVRVKAFTQNPQILLEALEGLVVEGGGLCPEASAEALEIALRHVKEGGTILLSTDASPYPETDLNALGTLIKEKKAQLHTIISGDCMVTDSQNAVSEDMEATPVTEETQDSETSNNSGEDSGTETSTNPEESQETEGSTSPEESQTEGSTQSGENLATETPNETVTVPETVSSENSEENP